MRHDPVGTPYTSTTEHAKGLLTVVPCHPLNTAPHLSPNEPATCASLILPFTREQICKHISAAALATVCTPACLQQVPALKCMTSNYTPAQQAVTASLTPYIVCKSQADCQRKTSASAATLRSWLARATPAAAGSTERTSACLELVPALKIITAPQSIRPVAPNLLTQGEAETLAHQVGVGCARQGSVCLNGCFVYRIEIGWPGRR